MPDPASPPQAANPPASAPPDPLAPAQPMPWRLTLDKLGMVIEMGAPMPANPLHVEGVNRPVRGVVRFIAEISDAKDNPVEYEIHVEPDQGTGFPDTDRPVMKNGKPVTHRGEPVYHPKWYRVRVPWASVLLVEEAGPEAFMMDRRDELESPELDEGEDEEDEEDESDEEGDEDEGEGT